MDDGFQSGDVTRSRGEIIFQELKQAEVERPVLQKILKYNNNNKNAQTQK